MSRIAPTSPVLTVTEVAGRLGVCAETVRRMVRRGDLRDTFRAGARIRIPAAQVAAYIERNTARKRA